MPAMIDLPRVAAHYAIAGPSERYADPAEVHAFGVERREWSSVASARTSLALGRIRVTARVTGEIEDADVAVLHTESGDTHCRVRTGTDPKQLGSARTALFRIFLDEGPARIPQALDPHFEGRSYGTEAVFCDERRRLLLGRLVDDGSVSGPDDLRPGDRADRLLTELRRTEGPVPQSLLRAAAPLLAGAAREELGALVTDGAVGPRVDRIRTLAAAARSLGIAFELSPEGIAPPIESALGRVLATLRAGVTAAAVDDALALLALGEALQAMPGLWTVQTEAAHLWRAATPHDRSVLTPLMAALGFAPAALANRGEGT